MENFGSNENIFNMNKQSGLTNFLKDPGNEFSFEHFHMKNKFKSDLIFGDQLNNII